MRDRILNVIYNHIKKTTEVTTLNRYGEENDRGEGVYRHVVLRELGLETGQGHQGLHAPVMMRVEIRLFFFSMGDKGYLICIQISCVSCV